MSQRKQIINDFYEKLHQLTPHGDQQVPYHVTAQWEPHELHISVKQYGDLCCTCGHPIKHVFSIHLIENHGVVYSPIGHLDAKRLSNLRNLRRRTSVRSQPVKQRWYLYYTAIELFSAIDRASGKGLLV